MLHRCIEPRSLGDVHFAELLAFATDSRFSALSSELDHVNLTIFGGWVKRPAGVTPAPRIRQQEE